MSKELYVHVDLNGKAHFVGRLWIHAGQHNESASFEYSKEWLSSPARFSLEPSLKLREGTFHTSLGKPLFGAFGDTTPDRWGRSLFKHFEKQNAQKEERTPRQLHDSDFLLMVNDSTRQGALRFSDSKNGPFLAKNQNVCIPPVTELKRLFTASTHLLEKRDNSQNIQDFVTAGGALGGARPKVSVIDTDGSLAIAKFPSPKDKWDVELWEYLAFQMAAKAGISTPTVRRKKIGNKNILLLKRFDRNGKKRIPFLSAMSMLDYSDGEQGSYLEIAEALKEYGADRLEDLKELWRRIVFNIMISNVDDHLRNHGFLYTGSAGWRLSPLYDLEPTPEHEKPRVLHTFIDLDDGTASLDRAYSVCDEFGLKLNEAKRIAKKVASVTQDWAKEAARLGVKKKEIEMMQSAFEHTDLKEGLKG
ncbi:type II toxin-antitoxin system HipA family toxin [Desulfobaculum bizertense]|uniref:Serine/threonine-protein kinase HipA n=1 Tax=Desulfobaculum bizertense DSM 18034 TaxID=1121442 RepID=A0A1T4VYG2_9BACT|nr:type II toxin-antitoxin system HipA family toxin [Desulfobaculum bizertense]SKA70062.1 serine/threonine-protein kinase HipA [Desulfobaculum bizertense DSM 18034]